jgi:hypothetical protein
MAKTPPARQAIKNRGSLTFQIKLLARFSGFLCKSDAITVSHVVSIVPRRIENRNMARKPIKNNKKYSLEPFKEKALVNNGQM